MCLEIQKAMYIHRAVCPLTKDISSKLANFEALHKQGVKG